MNLSRNQSPGRHPNRVEKLILSLINSISVYTNCSHTSQYPLKRNTIRKTAPTVIKKTKTDKEVNLILKLEL